MKRYILAGLLSAASFGFIINVTSAQMVGDVDPGTDSTTLCTNLTYNLRLGSRDSSTNGQVTMLQEFLVMKGLLLVDPTGYFGPVTLAAAKAYQVQAGLLNSGYVGPLTRAAIKTASCESGSTTGSSNSSTSSPIVVTIDASSGVITDPTTGSRKFVITGSVSGVNTIGISIGNAGGKFYGSGMFSLSGQGYRHEIPVTADLPFNPGQYTVQLYSETNVLLATRIVTVTETGAPVITLSPDTSIEYGKSATLTWNVTPSTGVTCMSAGGNLANGTYMNTSGSWTTPSLYTTTQYGMKCTNYTNGLSTTKYVTVTVNPSATTSTTRSITFSPATSIIPYGGTATFSWNITNMDDRVCSSEMAGLIAPAGVEIGKTGTFTTPPLATSTSYGIRCKQKTGGSVMSNSTTVIVTPPGATSTTSGVSGVYQGYSPTGTMTETGAPVITLSPDTSIEYGKSATLTWNVTPSTGVTCMSAGGNLANGTYMNTSGSWTTPSLYTMTEYGMRCTDIASGLSSYKYTTVNVTQASAPQITLSPDTTTTFGGTATITWSVTPSTGVSCVSAGGNLANGTYMSTSGSWTTPNLYTTTQYGMKCTSTNGLSSIKFVNVSVPSQSADSTSSSAPTITLTPDQTISYGGTANLSWNVTPSTGIRCESAGGNLASGTVINASGSWTTPTLYTNTQYGMRCVNTSNGLTAYKYTNVYVATPTVPSVTLSPDTTTTFGGTATITWNVTPTIGVSCVSAGGNLANGTSMSTSGSWTTPPLYTTTQYGMRCTNQTNGLSTTKFVTVSVSSQIANSTSGRPIITFTPTNITIPYGGTAAFSWNITDANGWMCSSEGTGLIKASGVELSKTGSFTSPSLTKTIYYGIRCKNATGTVTSNEIKITVASSTTSTPTVGSSAVPTITLSANGSMVSEGGTITATNGSAYIVWSSTGANSCTLNGNYFASSGAQTFTGLTNGKHTFACSNSYGSKSITFNVNVPASTPSAYLRITPATLASNQILTATWSGTNSPTSYNVKINDRVLAQGTVTSWTGTPSSLGLGAGTHTLYVQACNAAGCGAWDGPYFLVVIDPTAYAPIAQTAVLGASTLCVDLPTNMHRGYESYGVTLLQEFLKSKNFLGEVTGFYGDKTVAAVKEYQSTRGLPQTGMVYGFTRRAIKSDTCQ